MYSVRQRIPALLMALLLLLPLLPVRAAAEEGSWQSVAVRPAAGSGTESDPFLLTAPEELAYVLQTSFHARLAADLDLSGRTWTPGTFRGCLDGEGHVLRGLGGSALVSRLESGGYGAGRMENVTVEAEGTLSGPLLVETVTQTGTLQGCCITGSVRVSDTGSGQGWLHLSALAKVNEGTLMDCSSFLQAEVLSDRPEAAFGGLVYQNTGEMTGCRNFGALTLTAAGTDTTLLAGGLAVEAGGTFTACVNYADLSASAGSAQSVVGGVAALSQNSDVAEFVRCDNQGALAGQTVGGILGRSSAPTQLTGCTNRGSITGQTAGGIVGIAADAALLQRCANAGAVGDSSASAAGGIAGTVSAYATAAQLTGCGNSGAVTGQTVAGIAGGSSYGAVLTGCGNSGAITGTSYAAGVAAFLSAGRIEECASTGPVTGSPSAGVVCYLGGTALPGGGTPGLERCYACCDVVTTGYQATGVAGSAGADLRDCFFRGTLSRSGGGSFQAVAIAALSGSASATGCYALVENQPASLTALRGNAGAGTFCYANQTDAYEDAALLRTAGEMATAAFAAELDALDGAPRGVWRQGDPYPELILQDAPAQIGAAPSAAEAYYRYYGRTDSRTLRVFLQGTGYLPADQAPTVTAALPDGTTVTSLWAGGCAYLTLPLSADAEEGSVTLSCPGYVSLSLPLSCVGAFQSLRLWRDAGDGRPYLQALLLDRSEGAYASFSDLLTEGGCVRVGSLDAWSLYAVVDWGEAEPGTVTLLQDQREVTTLQSGWNRGLLPGQLFQEETGAVAVRISAGGRSFLYPLNVSVYPAATASVDVDGGDVSSADMPEDVDAVGGQSLKLDFSQLSGGLIPMELSVEEPGHVFKAVIGLQLRDRGHTTAAYGTLKNAIQAWGSKDPETAQVDQLIRDLEQFGTPQPVNASLGIKGEVQVLGYAEGVVEEGGSLRFSQCGLVFRFGGSVTYTQSFFVPFLPIPLYYEVGGSAELGLTSPIIHYDPQADALVPLEQTLEGQVSIFGGGGVGSPRVISGGIRGTGTLKVESSFPYDAQNATWSLQAKGAFVGSILGIKGEWTVWKTDQGLVLYQNGVWFPTSSASAFLNAANSLTRPRRVEAADRAFLPEQGVSRSGAEDSLASLLPLCSGVYEGARPQQAVFPDGRRLIVWIGDDPDRPLAANCAALFYSFYDGSAWSQPARVAADDGTADYDPVLLCDGTCAHLVWCNTDAPFTSDDDADALAQALLAQGIAYARFDPDQGAFTDHAQLSLPGDGADLLPALSAADGALTVVWANTDTPDPFLSEGTVTFRRAVLSHGLWHTEDLPLTAASADSLCVAYEAGETAVYCTRPYGADGTRALFRWTASGGEELVYGDDASYTGVQARDGILSLSRDGTPWVDGEAVEGLLTGDRFCVVRGDGIQALLYARDSYDADGAEESTLYAVFGTPERWGRSVALGRLSGTLQSFHGTFLPDGTLSVAVDLEQEGVSTLYLLESAPQADLTAGDLSVDSCTLLPGGTASLTVSCTNSGTVPLPAVSAEVRDPSGALLATACHPEPLLPGEEALVSIDCPLGQDLPASLSVSLAPMGAIDQHSEDNTASCSLALQDLSVEAVRAVSAPEMGTTVSVLLTNRGSVSVDAPRLTLRSGSAEGAVLAEAAAEPLPGRESRVVLLTLPEAVPEGTLLFACASGAAEDALPGNDWAMGVAEAAEAAGGLRLSASARRTETGLAVGYTVANDTGAALEAVAVACTRQGSAAIDTAAETLSLPAWGSAGGEALLSADGAGEIRLFLLDPRSLQPLCEPWVLTELP